MICPRCKIEIYENSKFCSNCGYDVTNRNDDLYCVTKIPTAFYILFCILTFWIYNAFKMYRMTGDIKKIVPREQTVSPAIITSSIFLGIIMNCLSAILNALAPYTTNNQEILGLYLLIVFTFFICSLFVDIPLYCHIVFHTLKNIAYVAEARQGKILKYNKFWAFVFGFIYINFVFNTYNKRLIDKN